MKTDKLDTLTNDIYLLNSLGEIVTLQIELQDIETSEVLFIDEFTDSEGEGLYVNNMILIRYMENKNYDFYKILNKIADLAGSVDAIESVVALIRIIYRGNPMEITVQIEGTQYPNVIQVPQSTLYFEIMHFVQTAWMIAKTHKK